MPLVLTPKHSDIELTCWMQQESTDFLHAKTSQYLRMLDQAKWAVERHLKDGAAYCCTSWGKDSVVLADVVWSVDPKVTMVWYRIEPIANPECALVRDRFLAMRPSVDYMEVEVRCRGRDESARSGWDATGTITAGAQHTAEELGTDRCFLGLRAEESGDRKRRIEYRGLGGPRHCAPLGNWTGADIFAHLAVRGLPVHPAYAYSYDGALDRCRIRVAEIGEDEGTGMGRADWEQRYYGGHHG